MYIYIRISTYCCKLRLEWSSSNLAWSRALREAVT